MVSRATPPIGVIRRSRNSLASKRLVPFLIAAGLLMGVPEASAFPTLPGELQNELELASACQACHGFDNPADLASEPPVNPYQWAGTMMGNSARDPVFWAGVAVAAQDMPGATQACVRCHAPRAFLEGRGDAIAVDELLPRDRDGVTCDLCHRAIDDGMGTTSNAQYTVDDVLVGSEVPRRGPWTYTDIHEHEWSNDNEWLASSAICGVCHDVTTPRPRVDATGEVIAPGFNEQRTYAEWLGSDLSKPGPEARSCIDCHMPEFADGVGCEQRIASPRHPSGARRHDLVGANRFMLEMMQDLYGAFGTDEVFDSLYRDAVDRLDESLPGAATLDVTFPAAVDLAVGVPALGVRVTNHTGHKLPTGYAEGRVMWLELTARYAGEVIWSSGRWDETQQTIEADAQVRRYEAIAEDSVDGTQLHLLRNDRWISDTRIPPRGLVPDLETDPVGDRYSLQTGVWPNWDEFEYAFEALALDPIAGAAPELEIEVRLLYVVNTREYIEHLEDVNVTNAAGTQIATEFEARGWSPPMILGSASAVVPLSGFATADTGDESTGDDGPIVPGGCAGCAIDGEDRPIVPLALGLLLFRARRRRPPRRPDRINRRRAGTCDGTSRPRA